MNKIDMVKSQAPAVLWLSVMDDDGQGWASALALPLLQPLQYHQTGEVQILPPMMY